MAVRLDKGSADIRSEGDGTSTRAETCAVAISSPRPNKDCSTFTAGGVMLFSRSDAPTSTSPSAPAAGPNAARSNRDARRDSADSSALLTRCCECDILSGFLFELRGKAQPTFEVWSHAQRHL